MASISSLSSGYSAYDNTAQSATNAARTADEASAQKASAEKTSAEKANAEKASAEKANAEKAAAETPKADKTSHATVQDEVDLSERAHAKLLQQQGESVASIAAILSIDPSTVDGYLGLTPQKDLEQMEQAMLKA